LGIFKAGDQAKNNPEIRKEKINFWFDYPRDFYITTKKAHLSKTGELSNLCNSRKKTKLILVNQVFTLSGAFHVFQQNIG